MIHTSQRARRYGHDVWLNARRLAEIEDILDEHPRHQSNVYVVRRRPLLLEIDRGATMRHGSKWGVLNEKVIELEWDNVLHFEVYDSIEISRVAEGKIKVEGEMIVWWDDHAHRCPLREALKRGSEVRDRLTEYVEERVSLGVVSLTRGVVPFSMGGQLLLLDSFRTVRRFFERFSDNLTQCGDVPLTQLRSLSQYRKLGGRSGHNFYLITLYG